MYTKFVESSQIYSTTRVTKNITCGHVTLTPVKDQVQYNFVALMRAAKKPEQKTT